MSKYIDKEISLYNIVYNWILYSGGFRIIFVLFLVTIFSVCWLKGSEAVL